MVNPDMPGKGLARASSNGGLARINKPLASIAKPLQIAERCQMLMLDHDVIATNLGDRKPEDSAPYLDRARRAHGLLLRDIADIAAAQNALMGLTSCGPQDAIAYDQALGMLSLLFGALNRKRADAGDQDVAALLAATADMFDPTTAALGHATGLWKPVSQHPVILALAVKRLLATQVFQPSPSEVREALEFVRQRIGVLEHWTFKVLVLLEHADAIVFVHDRAAWDAAYQDDVSGKVAEVMLGLVGEEPDDELPPSPRWQALQAKLASEEDSPRLAACDAKPAKRTSRPRKKKKT